jgi:RHS repeat-associated protein
VGTIQSYTFTLGPAGNRLRIEEAGGTVRTYAYDELYRLTTENVSSLGGLIYQKTFSYDPVGNRLTQVTSGAGAASISYDYDARDRLVGEGSIALAWDANGNLITKDAEGAYSWDFENRLIGIVMADGTVIEHAYDADGNRVRTEVTPPNGPPRVTRFLVDPAGSLSHVVAETDSSNNLTSFYVRGDDLLALMRPAGPGAWSTRYYHADGTGSIRMLTDESGSVTDTYTYTAFGELISHDGSDPQPHAFTGEPLDPNSGFQYHRARWMDPGVGRFTSMDPWQGEQFEPATLHKYLYANADPVDGVDPTGLVGEFSLGGMMTAIAVRVTLFTLSHPNLVAILGFVGAALIPEEIQNSMMASGLPGVTQFGGLARAEGRGILLIKNWASRLFASRELGRISKVAGEAFETFARRHLFRGATGPIPVGKGKQSLDLLWRNFLIELKTSRRLEPDDVAQLAAGAAHAKGAGLDLAYVFLRQPTKGTIETIEKAGGSVFYLFPF